MLLADRISLPTEVAKAFLPIFAEKTLFFFFLLPNFQIAPFFSPSEENHLLKVWISKRWLSGPREDEGRKCTSQRHRESI